VLKTCSEKSPVSTVESTSASDPIPTVEATSASDPIPTVEATSASDPIPTVEATSASDLPADSYATNSEAESPLGTNSEAESPLGTNSEAESPLGTNSEAESPVGSESFSEGLSDTILNAAFLALEHTDTQQLSNSILAALDSEQNEGDQPLELPLPASPSCSTPVQPRARARGRTRTSEEEQRHRLDQLKLGMEDFTFMSHVAEDEVAEFDLKKFWQGYAKEGTRFFCMYEMSQLFLGIPQSTMKLERDFHGLALTLTCLRTRLSDETLNALLLLKRNFWFLKEKMAQHKIDILAPLRKRSAEDMEDSEDEEA